MLIFNDLSKYNNKDSSVFEQIIANFNKNYDSANIYIYFAKSDFNENLYNLLSHCTFILF